MEEWKKRLAEEANDLSHRINSLDVFLKDTKKTETLEEDALFLLNEQLVHMTKYSEILNQRLELNGVDIIVDDEVLSKDEDGLTWQDRLVEETIELSNKLNNLHDYQKTSKFYSLDRANKDLLYEQSREMSHYLQILGQRLELLGVVVEHFTK